MRVLYHVISLETCDHVKFIPANLVLNLAVPGRCECPSSYQKGLMDVGSVASRTCRSDEDECRGCDVGYAMVHP